MSEQRAEAMAVELYEALNPMVPEGVTLFRPNLGCHAFLAKLPGPRKVSVSMSIGSDRMVHPVKGFFAEFLLKDRNGKIFDNDENGYDGNPKDFFSLEKMVKELKLLAELAQADLIQPNDGWDNDPVDSVSGLELEVLKTMLRRFKSLEETSKLTRGVVTQDERSYQTISKWDPRYNELPHSVEVMIDMYFGFPEGKQKFEYVAGFKDEQLKFLIETMTKVLQERIDATEKSDS